MKIAAHIIKEKGILEAAKIFKGKVKLDTIMNWRDKILKGKPLHREVIEPMKKHG